MSILSRSLAVGVLAIATLSGVAAHADNKIRILCPTWVGYAPVFVANQLGYFKALGIEVEIKFEDERANVMAAMARGDIELDMRTVGEYQGKPRDPSTPGIIIGTIDQSLGGDGVIADGSIKSVEDLKGKTVAAEPNIPARLLLQLELKKHNMTLADLNIKEIATADTVAVFSDSSIAAVATYQPFQQQALIKVTSRNPHTLVTSNDYPGIITDIIVVRQDDLKQNPDKYRKYLIGIYKAIEYFKTNRDDFIKISAPNFNLSPADFAASIDGSIKYTDFHQSAEYLGKPGANGSLFGLFETVMQLNLENGAASYHLVASQQIDNSIMGGISDSDLK